MLHSLWESPLSFDESAGFTAPPAFGTYRVLHQIGSGVLGPVFRTYDPQQDRLVAVKAFRLELLPEQVARLADALRRLVAAPGLNHPGLVAAIDAGLEGTTAYLATEYVAAETLDVALRHLAPAPLDRALPILSRIADAIDAAWAAGIGHGALHPRDVFVTVDTHDVRVTGVGVVPALESIGARAPVRRPYSAPERVNGDAWDVRADVYALGAIAHELLTRRRPAGSGEQDGALTTDTTPEQRVQIRRVLSAVLAERPQHRFQTARSFTDALAAIARGEAVAALPEPEDDVADEAAAPSGELSARSALVLVSSHLDVEQPAAPASRQDAPGASPGEPVAAVSPAPVAPDHAAPDPDTHELIARPAAPAGGSDPPAADVPQVGASGLLASSSIWHSSPGVGDLGPRGEDVQPMPASSQPFPWSALAAVAAAGLLVGALVGYQYARRTIVPASPPAAARSSAETEVAMPPEPVGQAAGESSGSPAAPGRASRDETAEPSRTRSRAAAPAPARAVLQQGRLVVRSIPPGALLVVDGRPRGQTPASLGDLRFGDHTVEVARSGFVPHSERVTLSASAPTRTLSVQLRPGISTESSSTPAGAGSGSVFIDSRPQAARVIVDGRFMGVTPLTLPGVKTGTHAVRLERTGYQSFSTVIGVKAGEQARVTAALDERRDD